MESISQPHLVTIEDPCEDFIHLGIIKNPEPCSFFDLDIENIKLSNAFPDGTVFRDFDPSLRPDSISKKWICFPEFPFFFLKLKFPFPPLFERFFAATNMSYNQAMPMIWRTLFVIQNAIDSYSLDLDISDLSSCYDLRSFGPGYFLFRVKSGQQHLALSTTQNDPKWKGRFFFVKRDSLPKDTFLPLSWIKKASFSGLNPPSKDRLATFLQIPTLERTFHPLFKSADSGSQEAQSSMSGSQKSMSRFDLSDLDGLVSEDTPVKIEKTAIKPRVPNLRSKTAASKKRKNSEVVEIEDQPILLEFNEAMRHGQMGIEQMSRSYNLRLVEMEDMKKIAAAKSKAMEKDAAEITKLKGELVEAKEKLKEVEESHSKDIEDLLADTKRDAAVAIFEARIKMAEDAIAKGCDASLWEIQSWKNKLAKLRGENPEEVNKPDVAEVVLQVTDVVMREVEGSSLGDEGKIK